MKIIHQIDRSEGGGLLGNKIKYQVFSQVRCSPDEASIVAKYGAFPPHPLDFTDFNDELKSRLENKYQVYGIDRFEEGKKIECETIQLAQKFTDAVVLAAQGYKEQIEATRLHSTSLGTRQEVEL